MRWKSRRPVFAFVLFLVLFFFSWVVRNVSNSSNHGRMDSSNQYFVSCGHRTFLVRRAHKPLGMITIVTIIIFSSHANSTAAAGTVTRHPCSESLPFCFTHLANRPKFGRSSEKKEGGSLGIIFCTSPSASSEKPPPYPPPAAPSEFLCCEPRNNDTTLPYDSNGCLQQRLQETTSPIERTLLFQAITHRARRDGRTRDRCRHDL